MIIHWVSKKAFGMCASCMDDTLKFMRKLGIYKLNDPKGFEKAYSLFSKSPKLTANHFFNFTEDHY